MAELIREWIMSCEQRFRESGNNPRLIGLPLQNPKKYITVAEDAMQNELIPGLPPSGSFENIMTAMYVFSRHLFA